MFLMYCLYQRQLIYSVRYIFCALLLIIIYLILYAIAQLNLHLISDADIK